MVESFGERMKSCGLRTPHVKNNPNGNIEGAAEMMALFWPKNLESPP